MQPWPSHTMATDLMVPGSGGKYHAPGVPSSGHRPVPGTPLWPAPLPAHPGLPSRAGCPCPQGCGASKASGSDHRTEPAAHEGQPAHRLNPSQASGHAPRGGGGQSLRDPLSSLFPAASSVPFVATPHRLGVMVHGQPCRHPASSPGDPQCPATAGAFVSFTVGSMCNWGGSTRPLGDKRHISICLPAQNPQRSQRPPIRSPREQGRSQNPQRSQRPPIRS